MIQYKGTRPDRAHVKVCEKDECIVCESWRKEMNLKALSFFLEYEPSGPNRELSDYRQG